MENYTFNIQIDDAEFKAKISNAIKELTRHWLKAILEHFKAKNIQVVFPQTDFFDLRFQKHYNTIVIILVVRDKNQNGKLVPVNALCYQILSYCERNEVEHYLADFDFLEKDKVYILPKAKVFNKFCAGKSDVD